MKRDEENRQLRENVHKVCGNPGRLGLELSRVEDRSDHRQDKVHRTCSQSQRPCNKLIQLSNEQSDKLDKLPMNDTTYLNRNLARQKKKDRQGQHESVKALTGIQRLKNEGQSNGKHREQAPR